MFLTNHEIALAKWFSGITMCAFIHTFSLTPKQLLALQEETEFMNKKLARETETNQESRLKMLENKD